MIVFCSIFSQLLQVFPRMELQRMVKQHVAERSAKGFTCWGQFVIMLFCHLASTKAKQSDKGFPRSQLGKGVP
jgi:hypothetical protein